MTSKSLFFRLMKKDLGNRLWVLTLIGLACFFAFPVTVAMTAGEFKMAVEESRRILCSRQIQEYLSFASGMTVFLMIAASLVCGISSFAYLNSRTKVDFYHSLPVRREMLFTVNYLDGILLLAVPYGIAVAAAAGIAAANGVAAPGLGQTALSAYGLHMAYFILLYTSVVMAVMLTGNMVIAILGSVVFSTLGPALTALIPGYYMTFFKTSMWETWQRFEDIGYRISPIGEYIYGIQRSKAGGMACLAIAVLLIAAAFAALACFLYRKRPSEAAGKAMAFEVTKPVVRIILVMVVSLVGGAFFWGLQYSTGWAVFGAVSGAVITHCIIEILYHFDFKKLFSHPVQMAGCVLVSVGVLLVFRYDLIGYDEYLPEGEKVEYASIQISSLNNWVTYGHLQVREDGSYEWVVPQSGGTAGVMESAIPLNSMQYRNVEDILRLAQAGIENLEQDTLPYGFGTADICYTMKSGRKVYRTYLLSWDNAAELVETIYANEDYLKGTYPLLDRTADSVYQVRYRNEGGEEEVCLNTLTQAEKAELLAIYQKEFSALTLEEMRADLPVGLIRFASEMDVKAMDWWKDHWNDPQWDSQEYWYGNSSYSTYLGSVETADFYPVYEGFTETIAFLKDHGVTPQKYFSSKEAENIREIEIYHYNDEMWETGHLLIQEPEQIEKLLPVMWYGNQTYYNGLFPETDLEIRLNIREPDNSSWTYQATIRADQVPSFVWEELGVEPETDPAAYAFD